MEINNLWVNNTVVICSKFVSSDGNQFSVRNTTSVCSSPGPTVFRGKFCEIPRAENCQNSAAHHVIPFKSKLHWLQPSCWRVHCTNLLLQNIILGFLCRKAVMQLKLINANENAVSIAVLHQMFNSSSITTETLRQKFKIKNNTPNEMLV